MVRSFDHKAGILLEYDSVHIEQEIKLQPVRHCVWYHNNHNCAATTGNLCCEAVPKPVGILLEYHSMYMERQSNRHRHKRYILL